MKYLLYTLEDIKEKEKIPKNCVLIFGESFFLRQCYLLLFRLWMKMTEKK
ncbi:hypothetical protein HMPREF9466_03180 [Fusobacterium necrophorum subsp. funduliforme 1_1_36S]|nr:hypothetical protein HMPREF9466_03180 [Fusobacterium necrophorum subsp. funduliforme 1_1_36S]